MNPLEEHAKLTIKTLERFLKNRGTAVGCGAKKWEKQLLESAYNALDIPKENRLKL